ncbi:MAG: hypothetical protein JWQ07_1967 [Ramlibacter sp.]|nr:hypothetical protein [Ramlibacter sp.]
MRKLIAPLAIAGIAALSGCVGYGGGTYGAVGVYDNSPYYGGYGYGGGVVIEQRRGYGYRDRDRDGVANRYDRDRDGDGVPNRRDAAPNDPRRY